MKKVLLSTIAIIGIVSGTAFAEQPVPNHQGLHSSGTKTHQVATVVHHGEASAAMDSMDSGSTGMVHMQGGNMKGMTGHGNMTEKSGMMKCGKSGMMMGRKGMMHDMSGGMHHGKKMDGMKGHGMMGLGFHMPGQEHWTSEQHKQFLDATTEIRRELALKHFEIKEAKRNSSVTPEQLGQLDKDLIDIRTKLQIKALEVNSVPAE